MTIGDYLLIPLLLFTIMLYPLLRKGVSLFEIYVNKYVRQTGKMQESATENAKSASLHTVLHLKLLAYERIVLFIERMKPDSLIPRTLSSQLSLKEYQSLLIGEIRKEFEYNLSQQLYLSDNAWQVTVSFKDNMITLINSAAAECLTNNASELAKKILERYIASDLKTGQILQIIKADIWKDAKQT